MICAACRFDPAAYGWTDLMGSLDAIGERWRHALDGRSTPGTDERSRLALAALLDAASILDVAAPGEPPDHPPGEPPDQLSIGISATALMRGVALRRDGARSDALPVVSRTLHRVQHLWSEMARDLAVAGLGAPSQRGRIAHLHSNDGGVPKPTVPDATIGYRGVVGDHQRSRKHHGRVWQALCLWSSEVIGAIATEGHPISHGSAGENITVTGIDWSTVRPGTRLQLGDGPDAALLELTCWALPCRHNRQWFSNGDEMRIEHERNPGASRIYASVLRDGRVRSGDPVIVEPS